MSSNFRWLIVYLPNKELFKHFCVFLGRNFLFHTTGFSLSRCYFILLGLFWSDGHFLDLRWQKTRQEYLFNDRREGSYFIRGLLVCDLSVVYIHNLAPELDPIRADQIRQLRVSVGCKDSRLVHHSRFYICHSARSFSHFGQNTGRFALSGSWFRFTNFINKRLSKCMFLFKRFLTSLKPTIADLDENKAIQTLNKDDIESSVF